MQLAWPQSFLWSKVHYNFIRTSYEINKEYQKYVSKGRLLVTEAEEKSERGGLATYLTYLTGLVITA